MRQLRIVRAQFGFGRAACQQVEDKRHPPSVLVVVGFNPAPKIVKLRLSLGWINL